MSKVIHLQDEDVYYLLNLLPAMKDIPDPQKYMSIISQIHIQTMDVGNPSNLFAEIQIGGPEELPIPPKEYFQVPLHANSDKIKAIKFIREITGMGLKEAKDAVDFSNNIPFPAGWDQKLILTKAKSAGVTVEFY
jgi:hypothetical protein